MGASEDQPSPRRIHFAKQTWNLERSPLWTPVFFKGLLFRFLASLGECQAAVALPSAPIPIFLTTLAAAAPEYSMLGVPIPLQWSQWSGWFELGDRKSGATAKHARARTHTHTHTHTETQTCTTTEPAKGAFMKRVFFSNS